MVEEKYIHTKKILERLFTGVQFSWLSLSTHVSKGRAGAQAGGRDSMVMLMSANQKPLWLSILYLTWCLQMSLLCRRKVRKSGPQMKQRPSLQLVSRSQIKAILCKNKRRTSLITLEIQEPSFHQVFFQKENVFVTMIDTGLKRTEKTKKNLFIFGSLITCILVTNTLENFTNSYQYYLSRRKGYLISREIMLLKLYNQNYQSLLIYQTQCLQ